MQRLWFPPGSASYKKADEIVAQDAWESTGCDVTQEANALTSAGERLRPHLQWISNTLPSAIWRLHQCNIEMNLRIKWGVKKYPVYSVPNQKIHNPNKTTPLNPLACHPQEENYKKLWHNLDKKRGQCRLALGCLGSQPAPISAPWKPGRYQIMFRTHLSMSMRKQIHCTLML